MELWTGIVCLIADPNCKEFRRFGDHGKGAYVNVVALVSSEEAFTKRVECHSTGLDCILLEFDGVQSLDVRMGEADYPEEILMMRSTAKRQPNDTLFGTFHIWTESDVN